VIRLQAGRPTNRGSIHRGNKRFASSPICPRPALLSTQALTERVQATLSPRSEAAVTL